MTFGDFKILVMGMKSIYTSDNFIPDAESMKVWYSLLGDYDYPVLNVAIQKYMVTNKFPPTPADLREIVVDMNNENGDWGEAWGRVIKAMRMYGHSDPKGALDSLDEVTRACVERMGWQELCRSENLSVERGQFRMIYENIAERKKKNDALPHKVRKSIEQLTNKMKQIEGR